MLKDSEKEILQRIMQFCAQSERCTQDVLRKLASWSISESETDELIRTLRREKFLDDDRFATFYVSDKWKLDQWGRAKIKNGLLQKGFDEMQIQKALDTIDQTAYVSGLQKLLTKKRITIKSEVPVSQMKKMLSYGLSRGFEEDLIWQWLEKEGLSFENNASADDLGED